MILFLHHRYRTVGGNTGASHQECARCEKRRVLAILFGTIKLEYIAEDNAFLARRGR